MQILCSTCAKTIPVEDINLDHVLAKCRSCNTVFDFSGQVQMPDLPQAKQKRDRGEIPLPPSLKVDQHGGNLVITRRWGRGPGIFFLVFSGLWNAIVLIIMIALLSNAAKTSGGARPPFLGSLELFFVPFILVGLGTAWPAFALLLNRTTIRVSGRRLSVTHGPVPWPGKRELDLATLDQLYCQEYVAYLQNNVPQYRFMIQAIRKDGSRLKLVRGMEDSGQALYLERLLETHLGIVDRPVPGEIQGGPRGSS
jgi:hypothetical protein